ncbi:hypothetical protein [Gimesia maris]|uniref:ORC-CDC6 family AAA ATPase n=1 Tax=Gimesia maris TaxID=122 RepID=UPI003A8D5D0E
MTTPRNPFTTLYVTERLDELQFPKLFSPILIPHITALFEAGNLVLEGTQGTGKSMLLALIQTEIRLAYYKNHKHDYPIQDQNLCQFLSVGINLATNQALRCVSRSDVSSSEKIQELRLSFIDYVNSWLLRDLISSIDSLSKNPELLWSPANLGGTCNEVKDGFKALADSLKPNIFNGVHPDLLIQSLTDRIDTYLKFFNGHPKRLPDEILDTQAHTLGQPLADAVNILRENNCLCRDTRILIVIDQFEQLLELEASLPDHPFGLLRETIDDAIHRREPTLNFRIGTRPYAWQDMSGEDMRDYYRLNLDEMLRRREHSNLKLFISLAQDVFKRRLTVFGYDEIGNSDRPIDLVFGKSPLPKERIEKISSSKGWSKRISLNKKLPSIIDSHLRDLAEKNPLDAKLGNAWVAQKLEGSDKKTIAQICNQLKNEPWNSDSKKWWKKERIALAILQLAADSRQRIIMYGKNDIITLSGGNILVFTSICQHIWDCWIREKALDTSGKNNSFPIAENLQFEGILKASNTWHRKIGDERMIGDTLISFVDAMGNWLRKKMVTDTHMSYPGGNGISLTNRDVLQSKEIRKVLSELTGRGFLVQRAHTPKSRERGASTKWYPHPILAPYYELTYIQTKEPRYIKSQILNDWLGDFKISSEHQYRQNYLFEEDGE